MKLSSVVRLYRVRLRARLAQELFAVAGIAIGVGLLFASQVANTSLNGSVQQLTSGIVGQMNFQVASRSSEGFDERLLSRFARLPGVTAAVPIVEETANIVGPGGRQSVDLVGAEPHLARLGGRIARNLGLFRLARGRVLTLPAPIADRIGASSLIRVRVQVGASERQALLYPEPLAAGTSALGQSPIALGTLRTVQLLTGMQGRLTSVFVRSPPRLVPTVRRELVGLSGGRLNVRPANFNTKLFARAAGPVNQSTALFSALSALVGFLFAFNALLLTVPQRRNLVEDLRLDGYTRRMIVEVLLLDALVLGVLATALGLVLGEVLSVALFSSSPGYLSFAFPIAAERIVTPWSIVLAVLGGMLAACTGVLVPLRREILGRPTSEAVPTRSAPRVHVWSLTAGAALCLGGTTLILLAAPQAAIVGVVSLTGALLLLMPVVLDLAVRAGERLQPLLPGAASYLAVLELRSRGNRARSLAIAATGAIAVFGSVSIGGARGSLQRGLDASARGIDARADLWVTAAGASNAFATTSFHDRLSSRLALLRGVRAVRLYRGSFLDWGARRLWVVAPPRADPKMIAASQIVAGSAHLANARLRSGGWAVLSRAIADEHHLHVGETFILPSAQPTRLRIAALGTNLGWSPGAVVLNAEDYADAWGSEDPSGYEIELARGASPAFVLGEVRSALGALSGLHAETRAQREQMHFSQATQGLSRLTQIRSLVLVAAVLAMAAAMGAMIWQRRTRLADMKVDGFSRGVLWRALLWESSLLLGVGCSLGAVFGLYGQLILSRALSVVNGFPVIESTHVPAALGSFALITAVAVAIVAVPGYVAARVRPSVGLQE